MTIPQNIHTSDFRANLKEIIADTKGREIRYDVTVHSTPTVSVVPNDVAKMMYDLSVEDVRRIRDQLTDYLSNNPSKNQKIHLHDLLQNVRYANDKHEESHVSVKLEHDEMAITTTEYRILTALVSLGESDAGEIMDNIDYNGRVSTFFTVLANLKKKGFIEIPRSLLTITNDGHKAVDLYNTAAAIFANEDGIYGESDR